MKKKEEEPCCFLGYVVSTTQSFIDTFKGKEVGKKDWKKIEKFTVSKLIEDNDELLRSGRLIKPCPDCGKEMPIPYEEACELISITVQSVFKGKKVQCC